MLVKVNCGKTLHGASQFDVITNTSESPALKCGPQHPNTSAARSRLDPRADKRVFKSRGPCRRFLATSTERGERKAASVAMGCITMGCVTIGCATMVHSSPKCLRLGKLPREGRGYYNNHSRTRSKKRGDNMACFCVAEDTER